MREEYGIAAATGDVMLSVDDLNEPTTLGYMRVFQNEYDRARKEGHSDRAEFAHAILRLLAAVRDKRRSEWAGIKRGLRHPVGERTEPYATPVG